MIRGVLLVAGVGLLVGACADDSGGADASTSDDGGGADDCPVGTERCECTSGGACDPGLMCLSGLCVAPDDGGATTGDGGGTGGTGGGTDTATDGGTSGGTTTGGVGSGTTGTQTGSGGSGTTGGASSGSGTTTGGGATTGTTTDGTTSMDGTSTETTTGNGSGGNARCKADILFIVDNSASMETKQAKFTAEFPTFHADLQTALMGSDFNIAVVDTDEGDGYQSSSCSGGANGYDCTCVVAPACCSTICSMYGETAICNGMPACDPLPPLTCDETLGGGKTKDKDDTDCGIVGGNRYMLGTQPNVNATFACLADVGVTGDSNERPMQAMTEAVGPLSAGGECNAGFVRNDALLIVAFVTDEEDSGKSAGDPATWKQALLTAKGGDEDRVAVLGFVGDTGLAGAVCTEATGDTGAEDSPVLRTFVDSMTHGMWASICEPSYATAFSQFVSIVETACNSVPPP